MQPIRVTINKEDAERLGVERKAVYRAPRAGETYVGNNSLIQTKLHECASWLVVTPKTKSFVERLNDSGWDPGVRCAHLRIYKEGIADVLGANGNWAACIAQQCPVRPDGIAYVRIGGDGKFRGAAQ